MDSAAAAYSDGDFPGARTHYGTATDSAPDLAAGWFGLFLAERALGNIPAADSALGRARSIAASDSVTARPGS
jgi:predicted TPR repeat methyltransferase